MSSWVILVALLLIWETLGQDGNKDKRKGRGTTKDTVVVNTPLGRIIGTREGKANAYLGVPFAEPPTGTHRFRPPRPVRPWAPSSYKAFNYSPDCLQSNLYQMTSGDEEEGEGNDNFDSNSRKVDEDCLYVNM